MALQNRISTLTQQLQVRRRQRRESDDIRVNPDIKTGLDISMQCVSITAGMGEEAQTRGDNIPVSFIGSCSGQFSSYVHSVNIYIFTYESSLFVLLCLNVLFTWSCPGLEYTNAIIDEEVNALFDLLHA